MAAHVEELEEAAAEAARRAAAQRTVRALAHDCLSWLEEVWGAKPSTVKDYSFLLRALDKEGLTPRNVNKHREVPVSLRTQSGVADSARPWRGES